MPNRILKDSICTSDDINALSLNGENLFYRLIVQCDDFGCFDGRASIIRAKCFPLRIDDIKVKDLEKWLAELSKQKLIVFYVVDGKRYLHMTSWSKHQQMRARKSRYPQPISDDINGNQMISDDSTCPPEIESESESESEIESESESICTQKTFGEFNNVKLTDEQLEKLKAEYFDYQERIERLSTYMASKGVKYKSHYATILAWARKDSSAKPVGNMATKSKGSLRGFEYEDPLKGET